ncbi:MAG: response regulator [Janthinobacterium lividum]
MAGRSFHIQKNLLRVVAGGSAILAMLFISIVAVNDWHDRMATYATVAMRTARAAEEHALKVLQLNEALEQQVIDYLDGFHDDRDVTRREASIHARLRAMALHIPSVVSIYIVDARGMMVASSVVYPVPPLSLAPQGYFRGAKAGRVQDKVSPLFVGVISHEWLFNTIERRTRADGAFDGVVSIALRPRYFTAFYRDTAGLTPPWRLRLSRTDGAVLAEYPSTEAALPPPGARTGEKAAGAIGAQISTQGDRHPADILASNPNVAPSGGNDAVVQRALAAGRTSGLIRPRSIFDSGASLLAFRKVDSFPVYVSASLSLAAIRGEWLRHMGLLAASLLLPCILLWSVIALSLRRLARSERDWQKLQAEIGVRKGVEEAYRQSLKMEALGRLVGSVAHEFNNLLMVVSANAQVARFAGVAQVAPQLAAIERAVRDGQNLTRQLLGVARKQPLRAEPVALRDWLAAQETRLRDVLGQGITLSWEAGDDCRVRVDPFEFELAVNNVALNAREAMPAGGSFAIGASTRWSKTVGGPPLNGEFVCIALRDNGAGMAPAVLSRAFEPLYSTKTEGRGMGLGLPQVFAFCEQAGGVARMESAPQQGTVVYLYLPRDVAQAVPVVEDDARRGALEPSRSPSATALRILLVEDDNAVAEANEELLMTMGHTVQRAVSADDAMALFDHGAGHAIDVVVSDIQMPGTMNGIDLAERLEQAWPRLPVLLVTGYTRELERARRANRPVFAKPFDIMALDFMLKQIRTRVAG